MLKTKIFTWRSSWSLLRIWSLGFLIVATICAYSTSVLAINAVELTNILTEGERSINTHYNEQIKTNCVGTDQAAITACKDALNKERQASLTYFRNGTLEDRQTYTHALSAQAADIDTELAEANGSVATLTEVVQKFDAQKTALQQEQRTNNCSTQPGPYCVTLTEKLTTLERDLPLAKEKLKAAQDKVTALNQEKIKAANAMLTNASSVTDTKKSQIKAEADQAKKDIKKKAEEEMNAQCSSKKQAVTNAETNQKNCETTYQGQIRNCNGLALPNIPQCKKDAETAKGQCQVGDYASKQRAVDTAKNQLAACASKQGAAKETCESAANTALTAAQENLTQTKLAKAKKDLEKCEQPIADKAKEEITQVDKSAEGKIEAASKDSLEAQQTAQKEAAAAKSAQAAAVGCKFKFQVELVAPFSQPPPKPGNKDWDIQKYQGNCFVWRGPTVNAGDATDAPLSGGHWYQILGADNGNELLTRYARMIYTFLAGVIGIISVLMVIVGGIQVSVGGVNQGAIESGKNRIIAALAGIALLFISSLILYTINPHFFAF